MAKDGVELVAVTKDGVTLKIHPTCVEAHLAVGWKLVTGE